MKGELPRDVFYAAHHLQWDKGPIFSGDTCRERHSPVNKKPKLPPGAGDASKQGRAHSSTVSGSPNP